MMLRRSVRLDESLIGPANLHTLLGEHDDVDTAAAVIAASPANAPQAKNLRA
jgi:hypothetical protein